MLCECGQDILEKNVKRHLKTSKHEKLLILKKKKPEYWELFLNTPTNNPDYQKINKKIDRYLKKTKNQINIILPIGDNDGDFGDIRQYYTELDAIRRY